MKRKITWGNLFDYLDEYVKFGNGETTPMSATCNNKLDRTKDFCINNNLNFGVIELLLRSAGGQCDCEVLLNCLDDFDAKLEIGIIPKGRYLMLHNIHENTE